MNITPKFSANLTIVGTGTTTTGLTKLSKALQNPSVQQTLQEPGFATLTPSGDTFSLQGHKSVVDSLKPLL